MGDDCNSGIVHAETGKVLVADAHTCFDDPLLHKLLLVIVVLMRYAIAETVVAAFLPILVLVYLQLMIEKRRWLSLRLSVLIALAWLTNIPAALVIFYILLFGTIFYCVVQKSPRPAIQYAAIAGWIYLHWLQADGGNRQLPQLQIIGVLGCIPLFFEFSFGGLLWNHLPQLGLILQLPLFTLPRPWLVNPSTSYL